MLDNQTVLITGGTGSLGKVLLRRILSSEIGQPKKIIIFSRDEAKQHDLRVEYLHRKWATDDILWRNFEHLLEFRIGDVRDPSTTAAALRQADVVFNAAALKQVPSCEYSPFEAVRTNIEGAENIVRAIRELGLPVKTVVGISTDKAVKPVNVMGMTKALQERIFVRANLDCPDTRLIVVRYGNVLASRGSVVPLFHEQIRNGGPVTITSAEMTRFLLSLEDAVDTIFAALKDARPGETFIPRVPSANIDDLARELIEDRDIETNIIGVRPGEKLHEILISEEEAHRTVERGKYYAIQAILPELQDSESTGAALSGEYSSNDDVMSREALATLLRERNLRVEDRLRIEGEFLR